jgi:hypothetical protein
MTTYTDKTVAQANGLFAALGAGLGIVLTAVGTFWDLTNNESGKPDGFSEFLPVVGIVIVATAVVFGVVARRPSPAKALGLGIAAVLSCVVFWSGVPSVLAAGALACAFGSPRLTRASKAGIGLATVATVLAIAAAIAG